MLNKHKTRYFEGGNWKRANSRFFLIHLLASGQDRETEGCF